MGAQNGIVGDDFGTELPETDKLDPQMAEIQNAAKYTKTREYQELKSFLETRMDFYRQYLPNGKPVVGEQDVEELGKMWLAANVIIGEFSNIINVYEQAAKTVKEEASARRKNA